VRLLLVHPWAGLPSRQALYLGLEENGWDLLIVTARRWNDDYGRIVKARPSEALRGELLALPVGLSGNIPLHFFTRRLAPHIRRFNPDCVYIYHEPYAVGTYQALRAAKAVTSAPVGVRSAQNINKTYPLPFRRAERYVYRHSDFAVVVSDNVAQVMRDKGYTKPISVIPMPVDTALFVPGNAPPPDGPLRIGFVGRLVPEKGVDTALRALAALPPDRATLTVIGDGPSQAELAALAASLGVADSVEWLGTLDRRATAEAIRHFDVMVVLSRATPRWREQFGRVVIEAAASAVPVIVTRSGELPFLVASLGAGWTVEEDDAEGVAAILGALDEDRQALAEAGRRARTAVAQHYTDQTIVAQLADTFTRAVADHRNGGRPTESP
jgi:glycosyltransferase involved in cell wall biosynthesis